MNINLKKETRKADLQKQLETAIKNNVVLQAVIRELVINPESEKAKGIILKVKKYEEEKKK